MSANRPSVINKKTFKLSPYAIVSFLLTTSLCSLIIVFTVINRSNVERLEMEQLITEKSIKIHEVISKLLYKTEALSALVVQGNISSENFDKISATIVDDPAILNVIIAPGGVVSNVYPLKGNEAVIGLDYLSEGAGNKEAILAKESGQLVFGGPFDLIQGGKALVGRLPVFTSNNNSVGDFWGIVSVTLKYPDALDNVGLITLEKQGYAYEIWRVSPETGEKQIIATSANEYNEQSRFIEKNIRILNAEWYFRVAPVRMWYNYPETWLLVFAGLFVSFLVAFVTQNNYKLKIMKSEIEQTARLDYLTGIFNRRYFMDTVLINIERSIRLNSSCFIIVFDVDKFKEVNDKYGHLAGDEALKEVTARVKNAIRPYDLFARYGGEEFIILASDIDETHVVSLTERIRLKLCETPFEYGSKVINISASFGIAKCDLALSGEDSLEQAIRQADIALYKAKSGGRNKSVLYDVNSMNMNSGNNEIPRAYINFP